MGYSFWKFGKFIIRSPYLYTLPLGIFLIFLGLERKKIHELLLRFNTRFFRK